MIIKCKCGCGQDLEDIDEQGRKREYINGHNGRKYNDPTQYKREWNHRNRASRYAYKKIYSLKLKIHLIYEKGAKCLKCGIEYNGINSCIFDFHHRNPEEKDFNLNLNFLNRYGKKRILEEVDKCDLLCSNCHRLEHADLGVERC
ncbi:MAG: hypothetical protein WC196_06190 [Bacilli bacterium]